MLCVLDTLDSFREKERERESVCVFVGQGAAKGLGGGAASPERYQVKEFAPLGC